MHRMFEDVMETDVLVIGGGLAGLRAAIEAHDGGVKVLVAMKGKLGKATAAVCAYHGAAVGPWCDADDTKELHLKDVIKCGGYLADQELCKIMIDELPERLIEFERYGLFWERNDDGTIAPYLGSGHSKPRTISTWRRQAGLSMIYALKSEILRRRIPVLEDTMVTNLLIKDGEIAGAVGLDIVSGKVFPINSKSTIIATGSHSVMFPDYTPPPECTGDGPAMAYEAGADMMNMENVVYIATIDHPGTWRGIIVPTLFKIGGDVLHLLNKEGERFLERYDPENLEMATKDVVARSTYTEIIEGRGGGEEGDTLYADLAHLDYEEANNKLGDLVTCMEEMGLDIRKDYISFRPAAHETLGGVRINARCESTIPGLYAAGSAIGAIYGNDGIPGRGTGHAIVFAQRAGKYACERARQISMPQPDQELLDAEFLRVVNILDRERGLSPGEVLKKLQETMRKNFWVVKNDEGLKEALANIIRIQQEDLPIVSTSSKSKRYNIEWQHALEVINLAKVAEMMIKSAMMRKETRAMFMRDDYPQKDNVNGPQHIVLRRNKNEMHLETIPVKLTYVQPEGDE